MSLTWDADEPPPPERLGPMDWLRVGLRGLPLAAVVFGGLAVHLTLRLVERPLYGRHRPVTPWITQGVCIAALAILGIGRARRGTAMSGPGAIVANHASWLDIFALNAADRVYFVSKDEVAGWPGIGWLARATGTLFIRRDRREAAAQSREMTARLAAGHRLLFFPEGTSTDGRRVLPFRTTLFSAFYAPGLPDGLEVQPVTLDYRAPEGADPRFYGWWGDMSFGGHLLKVLAAPRQGTVTVVRHPPVAAAAAADRKALARRCEAAVRSALSLPAPEA
ncbi:1-acyl-sn-glycerol-3-phosphate acyltransferase [Rhodobacteraceae bacterium CCMM004]|nr:1-acyl-sn-glycerol-3-phosphate acyltransferase [Rhodobacteraceae bacterium CCMM004]